MKWSENMGKILCTCGLHSWGEYRGKWVRRSGKSNFLMLRFCERPGCEKVR